MSLTIRNASVSSWSQSSGELHLYNPTDNVSVTCVANKKSYQITIQEYLNGILQSNGLYGFERLKIYYNSTNTLTNATLIELDLSISNTVWIPYLDYYWIKTKISTDDSTYTTVYQGQMSYSNIEKIINYYTVEVLTGTNVSSTPNATRYVLSGEEIAFYATKGSATGYTYSDTIEWDVNIGNISCFETTTEEVVYYEISEKTQVTPSCERWITQYTVTLNKNIEASCTLYGSGSYAHGTYITVYVDLHSGYRFIGWYENGESVSSSICYSFTVYNNHTIEARCESIIPTYTISLDTCNYNDAYWALSAESSTEISSITISVGENKTIYLKDPCNEGLNFTLNVLGNLNANIDAVYEEYGWASVIISNVTSDGSIAAENEE